MNWSVFLICLQLDELNENDVLLFYPARERSQAQYDLCVIAARTKYSQNIFCLCSSKCIATQSTQKTHTGISDRL